MRFSHCFAVTRDKTRANDSAVPITPEKLLSLSLPTATAASATNQLNPKSRRCYSRDHPALTGGVYSRLRGSIIAVKQPDELCCSNPLARSLAHGVEADEK